MMKLFSIDNNKLTSVSTNPFQLERDIQKLIENNVQELFDLEFVKSELTIQNFRLDTLCFNKMSNSFVIIEYKKGSNYSVIDQGYTYLSTLLNNKSDFILEYNETLGGSLKRDEIDWSQSRVIFISPKFSEYQKTSINFKNLPFELWEVTRFKNNLLGLTKIDTNSDVDITSTVEKDNSKSIVKTVSKEIVTYDENYHINKNKSRPQEIVDLYYEFKDRVLSIGDNIELNIGKTWMGFKQNRIFCDVVIFNEGVVVYINMKKGELNDYLKKCQDMSDKGHWGNGDYKIVIRTVEDIDYVMSLVKQSFNKQV
jgi:predicted transport protein